jgi:hypothetical protein
MNVMLGSIDIGQQTIEFHMRTIQYIDMVILCIWDILALDIRDECRVRAGIITPLDSHKAAARRCHHHRAQYKRQM